jgi:chemotaxis protein methyltransferase CheR
MNALRSSLQVKDMPNESKAFFTRLQADFAGARRVSSLLLDLTGMNLPITDKNKTLIASRLQRVLMDLNFETYDQYMDYLARGNQQAIGNFISALTTNTTRFFRESIHYRILVDCLKERAAIRARHGQGVSMWCAACSYGQEAYSMAMVADLSLGTGTHYSVLATDIDQQVLAKAQTGVYSEFESDGIPPQIFDRYLTVSKDGRLARINRSIRQKIEFGEFNLSAEKYPFENQFDVIFCRNVLIYFDKKVLEQVVMNLSKSLAPGGYLFLGLSESSAGRSPGLRTIKPSFFRKEA